jgi:hypothetical protein
MDDDMEGDARRRRACIVCSEPWSLPAEPTAVPRARSCQTTDSSTRTRSPRRRTSTSRTSTTTPRVRWGDIRHRPPLCSGCCRPAAAAPPSHSSGYAGSLWPRCSPSLAPDRGPPSGAGMLEGDDLREALEGFQQVVGMEADKGEWCVHLRGWEAALPGCALRCQPRPCWTAPRQGPPLLAAAAGGSRPSSRSSSCTTRWAATTR